MQSKVNLSPEIARIMTKKHVGKVRYKIPLKRLKQIAFSIPHYFREIAHLESPTEFYSWLYYKTPYLLPLAGFPSKVTIETTNHCNYRCIHCHREIMARSRGYIDLDIFKKAVDEISQHPSCSLKIGGLGEPALHPLFGDMMEYLSSTSTQTTLYTNGHLMRRFTAKDILNWKIEHLVISIDGLDQASFEQIRVRGKYEEVKENVAELYRLRDKVKSLLPNIEVRHVIFPEESAQDLQEFRSTWLNNSDSVKFNYLIESQKNGHNDLEGPFKRCRDVRREAYIRWDGRMPMCGYQFLFTQQEWLGDLHEASIKEMWSHPRLQEVRGLHKKRDLRNISFCKPCESC